MDDLPWPSVMLTSVFLLHSRARYLWQIYYLAFAEIDLSAIKLVLYKKKTETLEWLCLMFVSYRPETIYESWGKEKKKTKFSTLY